MVDADSKDALREMRIGERLSARVPLGYQEYAGLLKSSVTCLLPERNRTIETEPFLPLFAKSGEWRDLLVWTGTKDYHRHYDWITGGSNDS